MKLSRDFAASVAGTFGESGKQWLVDLPDIVESVATGCSLAAYHLHAPVSHGAV